MCLAVPAEIKEIKETTAIVDFGGVKREVSLGIVEGVKRGDYVLIDAGFAIGKVDKKEAQDTLRLLYELNQVSQDDINERKQRQ